MNKRQLRNLEVLSRIDERIVDWSGKKRAALKNGRKKGTPKKKWYIAIGSAAAALLLVLGTILLLVNLLAKQVPVYTGMTVSNTDPTVTASVQTDDFLADNGSGDNGLHKGHYKGDYKQEQGDLSDAFDKPIEESLTVLGGGEERYYAKPNENIYITIHIDNPDSFEILSFTLNGVKYSTYMFEPGSDMEHLILKVDVGDVEGVVEYTVDAIKYVDGSEIKDVRMEGDQTVEIGVYTEKQPTAAVSGEVIGYNDLSFTVSAADLMGLVADSTGKLEAVLYDGDVIVQRQDIATVGDTAVAFTGLKTNTLYQYAIVAHYDALDGKGYSPYVLAQRTFCTKAVVLFDQISLATTGMEFAFVWDAAYTAEHVIDALALYQNGAKVADLAVNAQTVSNLQPDTTYVLTASYRHGGEAESISLEFTTDPLVYTVTHFLEKTDGGWEAAETRSDVIALNASVEAALNQYTGFTAPQAQTVVGSISDPMHVEYYYSRTVYTLTMVRNDGAQPDTMELKYGYEIPGDTRDHFGGWFTDETLTQLTYTVPADNITLYAKWDHWTSAEQLCYTGSETLTVTGLQEGISLTDLVIPAYIGGKRVAAVADQAFRYQSQLEVVTVPATVTRIGQSAFGNCGSIRSMILPFTGAAADGSAPSHFGYIFGAADAQGNGLALPDALKTVTLNGTSPVAEYAFLGCTGLEAVTIGTGVTDIGNFAFDGCTQLATVSFPAGLAAIGEYAFRNCTMLTTVALPDSLATLHTGAFYGAGLTAIEIPANVTAVSARLFYDCKSLKTAVFEGDRLTQISGNIFHGCEKLENVQLPPKITSIPYALFYGCASLKSIAVPAGVTQIYNDVFLGCTSLARVDFGGTLSQWASINFSNVASNPLSLAGALYIGGVNVTSGTLTVPTDVTAIGAYAFCGCTGITGLVISENVVTIGAAAFEDCTALTSISFNATAMSDLTADSFSAAGSAGAGIAVTFGANVTKVPGKLFAHYDAEDKSSPNVKSISFVANSACLYINTGAFANCITLSSASLPEGLKRINVDSFYNNDALASIAIPASVVFIGGSAFASCDTLQTVSFAAEQADYLEIGKNAFANCTQLKGVSLPRLLKTIDEKAFRNCSSLATLTLPNTVRSIAKAAFQNCTSLQEVSISDPGVTFTIGDEVFLGCTALKTVKIAADMNTLSMDSFNGCTSLTTVQITGGIEHIGTRAFAGCIKLTDVSLPSCLIRIRNEAFKGCTALTKISLPEGLTELQNSAFQASGLTEIELPTSVTTLGAYTFQNCKSLASVNFKGDGIKAFNGYIFSGCEKLKSIVLPSKLGNIAYNTFYNCVSLESITIPATVTQVSPYAFEGCTALSDVYFTGTIEQWNGISFDNEKSDPCYYAKHLWIGGVDVMVTKAP